MNVYDWDSNILEIKSKNDVHYKLKLKGQTTVVKGSSATGKTFLFNLLKSIKDSKSRAVYNVDNIILITRDNKEEMRDAKGKLIVIDRADLILQDKDVERINMDRDNRHILFMRSPIGLDISPNYVADMIEENGVIGLKYRLNVRGWN